MGAYALRPETRAERLIHWSILSTWGLWLLGALYPFGPLLGAGLLLIALYDGFHPDADPDALPHVPPLSVWVWVAGMTMMAVALVIGHLDFDHRPAADLEIADRLGKRLGAAGDVHPGRSDDAGPAASHLSGDVDAGGADAGSRAAVLTCWRDRN